jgi:hypothetical protein
MVYFHTNNTNLGIFWKAFELKMSVHFTVTLYILLQFGNFVVICYIFPQFGLLYQEKSGNPAPKLISNSRQIVLEISDFFTNTV